MTQRHTYWFNNKHVVYVASSSTYDFKISSKLSRCEAEIFIEPPTQIEIPSMYTRVDGGVLQLKQPYNLWHSWNTQEVAWKTGHVNTPKMYSVLVTANNFNSDECSSETCQAWVHTAWIFPDLVIPYQHLLIWKVTNSFQVFVHCRFCNPCRPFLMLGFKPGNKNWLRQLIRLLDSTPRKLNIGAIFHKIIPVSYLKQRMKYNSETTMNFLRLHGGRIPPKLIHPLLFSHIFSNNTQLSYDFEFSKYAFSHQNLWLQGCQNEYTLYSPNLLLEAQRRTRTNIAEFSNAGLILSNTQLKFLACHIKRQLWVFRLTELVSPFDASTWFLLIFSIYGLSVIIRLQLLRSKINLLTSKAFYGVFSILLEKGDRMFDWFLVKEKGFQHFVTFGIPFVLLILSNEYRGDNITQLTVEPSLHAFDNFDDLVAEKFPVYTMPLFLSDFETRYLLLPIDINETSPKSSNHEYFPMVSQLWYAIMLQWEHWNTLNIYARRMSNRTWYYLNNTLIYTEAMYQRANYFPKFRPAIIQIQNNWLNLAKTDLQKCNRSALLMDQKAALSIYTELRHFDFPVFFGKDIIHENMLGYKFFGQIPCNVYVRTMQFYESGICDFWNKYFDFLLV